MSNSPDVSEIANLSALDFAAVVPSILPSVDWRHQNVHWSVQGELRELLVSRLGAASPSLEDPLVSAIHSILADTTPDAAQLKFPLVSQIIGDLPRECIEPYRDPLALLVTDPPEGESGTIRTISETSADILEFLDASEAWVPRHKCDDLAIRSLDLLVHTAEEMRLHVPGLLGWLQDPNWPPFPECLRQLERFPEIVIDPIREILRSGYDGVWEFPLLQFLQEVPPHLMEMAREEVERIAQRPTQSEIDSEVDVIVIECLQAMGNWAERRKRSPRISS
ncbi:hypothetical protein B0H14DRAFT_2893137 [Mycena olivaceomarginata]|nr:hypothetical protein B0H14DRAFT_2893137 [Mycena olivaceomarginata]